MTSHDRLDPRGVPEALQQLLGNLESPDSPQVRRAPGPGGRARRAAVLIMVGEDELDITFTERAAHMRNHAGQMSFPGGSLEPGEGVVEAAVREAHEEVRLDPSEVRVLGRMPLAAVTPTGYDVAAVVGLWSGDHSLLVGEPAEVAAIHRFTVEQLADPSHRFAWRLGSGHSGPAFVFDDIFIWGFTAHLVDRFLQLGGFAREWDPSVELDVPWRFLRR